MLIINLILYSELQEHEYEVLHKGPCTTDDLADGKWQMIPGDGLDNFNDQLRHGKIKLKETETGELYKFE